MRRGPAGAVTLSKSRSKRPPRGRNNLIRDSIDPKSLRRYDTALDNFLTWCKTEDERAADDEELDLLVAEYIQSLYDGHNTKGEAKDLRSCLVFYRPLLKGRLGLTDRALAGWDRHEPARSWPPITYGLALGAATALWTTGDHAHALAILLAFECYLRNSETCNLRVQDVTLPGDARVGHYSTLAALVIKKAKTGKDQMVYIRDPLVIQLLKHFTAGAAADDQLLPGLTPRSFRRALRLGLKLVGFDDAPYTVHSLRHGGATRDYIFRRETLEGVLERGRWRSVKTTRIYLQSARSVLLSQAIPAPVAARVAVLESARGVAFGFPHMAA